MTARRVLFALLALTPLAELPGTGYDALRLPLALALGAALLAAGPAARFGTAGLALLAFLGARAVSLCVSPDLDAGTAAVLVTAASAAAYLASRGNERDLSRGLTIVAGVLLAAAAWQRFRGQPPASLLGNSNYAGAFAAMLLPALAAGPRDRLAWFGAAAAGALLALSQSRGGLAGAAAGAAVAAALLWRGGRRREAGLIAGVLGVAAALGVAANPQKFVSSDTLRVRTETWKASLRMAAERPLLGVGAGGFQASFPPYRSAEEARLSQRHAGRGFREVEDAHSSWIQAFAEGGVPGLLAWLILAGFVLFRAWRAGPEGAGWAGAATAFLVAGLFNTLTAHAAHAVLFGLVLGLLDPPGPDPAPRPAIWTAAAALAVAALVTTGRIPRDLAYYQATDHPDPRVRLSLLEHEPGWRARYQKAVDLDRAGRLAEAVDAYREVLRLRPFHGASLHNLAVVRLKAGAPRDEVEGLLARALEGAPHYYLTHFTLGLRRLEERDLKGARGHFERAAWLNENHPASRYGIAESFLAEGDIPGALPHLRRARELGVEVWAALRRDHASLLGDPRLEEFRR